MPETSWEDRGSVFGEAQGGRRLMGGRELVCRTERSSGTPILLGEPTLQGGPCSSRSPPYTPPGVGTKVWGELTGCQGEEEREEEKREARARHQETEGQGKGQGRRRKTHTPAWGQTDRQRHRKAETVETQRWRERKAERNKDLHRDGVLERHRTDPGTGRRGQNESREKQRERERGAELRETGALGRTETPERRVHRRGDPDTGSGGWRQRTPEGGDGGASPDLPQTAWDVLVPSVPRRGTPQPDSHPGTHEGLRRWLLVVLPPHRRALVSPT